MRKFHFTFALVLALGLPAAGLANDSSSSGASAGDVPAGTCLAVCPGGNVSISCGDSQTPVCSCEQGAQCLGSGEVSN